MADAAGQDGQHAARCQGGQWYPLGDAVPAGPDPVTALERLDAALDPAEFVTTLVLAPGRRPRLMVGIRRTRAAGEIYVDSWFSWSWAERIAPADEPLMAAQLVTAVLRVTPPAWP